ncbi:Clp protease N-terminal domain-containing protein [Saccharothrix violaceirubra]|nr:Clp protease N-terminal domain-containing protein [Saccharothrix violaceirubra]
MTPVQLTDLIVAVAQEHVDPLTRLTSAVELSGQLDELGDHLIGHFVDEARRSGASWTDIGASIGVTKQAAQKRFVPRESVEPARTPRYTDRAHRVVVLARHHARFSERIGTGHVLLGLLDESGGQAAKTIAHLEASDGTTRMVVLAELRDTGPRPDPQPFSAHCTKALELGVRASLRLGQPFVGTEHLLLGLLAETEGTAAKALAATGVTLEDAESHIVAEFRRAISGVQPPAPRGA